MNLISIFVGIKPLFADKNLLLVLLTGWLVCSSSCAKKGSPQVDNESQCMVDNAIAGQEISSVIPAVFKHLSATRSSGAPSGFSGGCAAFTYVKGDTITFNPAAEYVLDADHLACSLGDGKSRSGKIRVWLGARFGSDNAVCTVRLENYQADGYRYQVDDLRLTGKGSNVSYYSFLVELSSSSCSSNEEAFSYSCRHTLSYYPARSLLTFYGESSGTSRIGEPYTVSVTKDVSKLNSCACYDAGEVTVSPKNFSTRTVSFGDGTCDDRAIYAVNQNTVAFKLK